MKDIKTPAEKEVMNFPDDPAAVLLMVDIADDKIDQMAVAAWFRDRLVPL